jgi:hypothetical protein
VILLSAVLALNVARGAETLVVAEMVGAETLVVADTIGEEMPVDEIVSGLAVPSPRRTVKPAARVPVPQCSSWSNVDAGLTPERVLDDMVS